MSMDDLIIDIVSVISLLFFFMSTFTTDSDPPPTPPIEPALEDCCQSGCDPCIFDIYQDALERYRQALQQWQARQDAGAATLPRPRRQN
ncbi:Oxidoreductase-like protein [Herbaspirillum sp. CF444]|nr:Oxidoreductase-like protein [Herbaspirillum sp. CF444]